VCGLSSDYLVNLSGITNCRRFQNVAINDCKSTLNRNLRRTI